MITTVLFLLLTISAFWGAKWCYQRKKKYYLSPLLIAPIAIIGVLLVFRSDYDSYQHGAKWISYMLQPATVALAIPLYRYYPILKKHLMEILISVSLGAILSVILSFTFALLFHLNHHLLSSLIPYSITTPIAMGISDKVGGIPSITAVFVIITGVMGTVLGPTIIRLFHLKSDISKGILLGISAHGAGTAKALELSKLSGAVSSVCMILSAIFAYWLSPWIFLAILS